MISLRSALLFHLRLKLIFSLLNLRHFCSADANTILAKRDTSGEPPYPWTYDNDLFGGPDFWGLVSRDWRFCRLGRLQSPVNIEPKRLLFDPHLSPLRIAEHHVETTLRNTGQFPVITVRQPNSSGFNGEATSSSNTVNISGGPAFPYSYHLHQAVLHFGSASNSSAAFTSSASARLSYLNESPHSDQLGSEHTVDHVRFPAEIQLLAFNSDLYENFSQAMIQPKGILAIAIIVDIGATTNFELRRLIAASKSITYKNRETIVKKFNAKGLLPQTEHYVTYEGSLTFPGCQEGVTWIVMNSPIYITRDDLNVLNQLQQREEKDGVQQPPLFMSGNFRPLKPLNGRLLRTNINVKYKSRVSGSCPSNIYLDMGYRTNPHRTPPSTTEAHNNDKNNNSSGSSMKKQSAKIVDLTKRGKLRRAAPDDWTTLNDVDDDVLNEVEVDDHMFTDFLHEDGSIMEL